MKKRGCIYLVLLLSVIILIFLPAPATAVNCGGDIACNCSNTLNASRTLNASDNLTSCGGDGLYFGADGLTLDCNGYSIYGSGTEEGLSSLGGNHDNLTIKNCNISNFETGIYFLEASGIVINNNSISNNDYDGIYLSNLQNSTIANNSIFNHRRGMVLYGYFGDRFSGFKWNIIENNSIYLNDVVCIPNPSLCGQSAGSFSISQRTTTRCLCVTIDGEGAGIYLKNDANGNDDNIIRRNTIQNQTYGIFIEFSNRNSFQNNTIKNHNNSGISISSNDNVISGGEISNNNLALGSDNSAGIFVESSFNNNNISNVSVHDNRVYGVFIKESTNNIIGSNISYNVGKGVFANGATVNIENGEFEGNSNYGITSSASSIYWNITGNANCTDNNISISGNITFLGGSLGLHNCTLTLDGVVVADTDRTINSLAKSSQNVVANESSEMAFDSVDSNITLMLAENVSATVIVLFTTPETVPADTLNLLKGIDVKVDNSTRGNLTWALIKIFYNATELAAADIEESTLKIYFYNTTSAAWQLEPSQGVNAASDFVWANVTHFSLFAAFGSAAAAAAGAVTGGGGGGGIHYECSKNSDCDENYACQQHKCVQLLNVSYECSKDADCDQGYSCSGHKCIKLPEPVYECSRDKDCNDSYSCYGHKCLKLFDAEILEVAPLINSLSFELKYFIIGRAKINGDVIIKFRLERLNEEIMLGQDTVYLEGLENKTKTTKLNLPSNLSAGDYDLYVQVGYENYKAESFRKINIALPENLKAGEESGTLTKKPSARNYSFLLWIAGLVIISVIFYYLKKKLSFFGSKKKDKERNKEKVSPSLNTNKTARHNIEPAEKSQSADRYARLSTLEGKEVYSSYGSKIGKIKEAILSGNRIYGWIVVLAENYNLNQDILIKHETVMAVKDVFIVDGEIEGMIAGLNSSAPG